jgi:hypothetical protein
MGQAIKLFKYEILKIIIFLLLFGLSLVYVFSAQENYYMHDYKQSMKIKPPVQEQSN